MVLLGHEVIAHVLSGSKQTQKAVVQESAAKKLDNIPLTNIFLQRCLTSVLTSALLHSGMHEEHQKMVNRRKAE